MVMSLVNELSPADQSLLLLPQNLDETEFDGYVIIKNEEYRLKISLVSPNTLDGARFESEWKVKELIQGYEPLLKKRLQQSSSLASFLEEFKVLIDNLLSLSEVAQNNVSGISYIIKQMAAIGWDNLLYTNEDFTMLKLSHSDEKNRQHVISIKTNNENGTSKTVCLTDLPVPFVPRCSQNAGDIKLIYEQFMQVIHSFQQLWDALAEIDKCCWILEPENVTYACTYRRVALGKNASIYIQLNPSRPFEFPECKLLGADNVIEPLKEKLNSNFDSWNNKLNLLDNLVNILDITFPSPSSVSKEDISMTCGICYSYRLDEEIPECTCDDPRCGQTYHNSCLIEWLRSLPTCRQSFNVIFGECPYCNKSLTVRLKTTR